ncbi:hypothetical protein HYPSUDRAFT_72949 [Hypholoma sublateritium FD-334 SS-4]|uniref:Uncharacterized protein n=1 Tax=Hypholoma sublateritium (strain FD-334 SS-4) TaxID=945553 RepID=A0A0D2LS79_HYPSF|nr:hypothetical protein HYPSUDRAFT_72949 [Hypholoma sublateritium FD-334 SS-4]
MTRDGYSPDPAPTTAASFEYAIPRDLPTRPRLIAATPSRTPHLFPDLRYRKENSSQRTSLLL